MLKFTFNEEKATQTAALLLEKDGGRMNYMKLIKLMYLIDREALAEWERPLTGDSYFSLKHGPILSNVLDCINSGDEPGRPTYWHKYISKGIYDVALKTKCVTTELSRREISLIDAIYVKYKAKSEWDLVEYCHNNLPEWENPGKGRQPIYIKDILMAVDKTEQEILEIEDEVANLQYVSAVLSS